MTSHGNPGEGIAGAPGNSSIVSNNPANIPATLPVQHGLSAALDLAALGFSVFPCWPRSKEPATPRGFYNATTNPATLRRWWLACPDYNIAIATGIASGVWVLDGDGDDGVRSLIALEAKHGRLPDTLISITGSGCHLWFKYTSPIACSADDRVGRGLHVRGDGGYVLAPPSVHPDGPLYRWSNNKALAVAPEWLLQLTRKPPPEPITSKIIPPWRTRPPWQTRPGRTGAYGRAALEREIAELANTLEGGRNAALNRASFCLHQLVAGGELNGAEVHRRLIEAATANGLMSDRNDGPRSVALTIASGARAGLQHPRTRWGRS